MSTSEVFTNEKGFPPSASPSSLEGTKSTGCQTQTDIEAVPAFNNTGARRNRYPLTTFVLQFIIVMSFTVSMTFAFASILSQMDISKENKLLAGLYTDVKGSTVAFAAACAAMLSLSAAAGGMLYILPILTASETRFLRTQCEKCGVERD